MATSLPRVVIGFLRLLVLELRLDQCLVERNEFPQHVLSVCNPPDIEHKPNGFKIQPDPLGERLSDMLVFEQVIDFDNINIGGVKPWYFRTVLARNAYATLFGDQFAIIAGEAIIIDEPDGVSHEFFKSSSIASSSTVPVISVICLMKVDISGQ